MTSREDDAPSGPLDTVLAYAALVRLPNLFTAAADVTMGFLFACPAMRPGDGWGLGMLIACSCSLYAAGTVLNDVFDYRLDLQQRPERPLPSGRISLTAARWLGCELICLGLAAGCLASYFLGRWLPCLVAALLAASVVLYDAWLKRTPLGPAGMGLCRMLNVLLGMAGAAAPWASENWLVAGAIGLYIVGVTWLARREAQRSRPAVLLLATLLMMAGIGLLAWLPQWTDDLSPMLLNAPSRWHLILAALAAMIGWRCVWAMFDPRPRVVQAAVRQAILSLVMLDAAACFAKRDMAGAIVIAALMIPAVLTAQWLDST